MPDPAVSSQVIRFGVFELDLQAGELRKNGAKLKLQDQPFQMLSMLVEHPGELVSREDVRRRLWPADTFVNFNQGLNRALNKLREVLGDSAESPRFIETLSRRGYRFIAPVTTTSATSSIVPHPNPAPSTAADPGHVARSGRSGFFSRWQWIMAAGIVTIFVVGWGFLQLGAGFYWRWTMRRTQPFAPKALAVLPLSNLSADPAQEYFADGMTEALITKVANIPNLRVISRTSVMQYKRSKKSVLEIARELDVDAVVEGGVLLAGGRVRITAQLIRAADDRHLWAEAYERDVRDVVFLQDEVARDITEQIAKNMVGQQQTRLQASSSSINPEAHDAYLRGRYFWNKRTEAGYADAISYFQKAIEIDPNYAQAYAGLADAYALLGSWPNASISRSLAMPKAKQAALKALQLDDHLAEAHTSLAFVEMHYDWKFKDAEKEFQQALQLSPSYSTAHQWFAYDLIAMRRMPEALAEIQYAERLDPASVIINNDLGEMLLYNAQFDAAIMQLHKVLQMDPNFSHAHAVLAWVYEAKKMYPEAIAEMRVAVKGSGGNWYIGSLAYACAIAGQQAEAQRLLRQLGRVSTKNYDTALDFAQAYAGLGNKAAAFSRLEMGYQQRSGSLILLGVQPEFRVLRADPRYADLMRRVGLPQ
jgi:TolB-like protein/DNA-binding winged helix-turn-helix (wHTH) protein/Tfp pilus assembly protein PilF